MSSAPNTSAVLSCDCCAGIAQETPRVIDNRPGLSAIAYRVGNFQQFRDTLIARLQLSRQPFLNALKARENDDFTIALLDSFSAVADVLTFYTERYQQEAYLRTAVERRSILELATLIGYELRPGVAAHTFLAFNIDPNAAAFSMVLAPPLLVPTAQASTQQQAKPDLAATFLVDVGTKVQSVPGPGEKPQTFETVEAIQARAEWNAITPMLVEQQVVSGDAQSLVLNGAASNIKPGDKLLLLPNPDDLTNFFLRSVSSVTIQPGGQSTIVQLEVAPLRHIVGLPKLPLLGGALGSLLSGKSALARLFPKLPLHFGCPDGHPSDFRPNTPLDLTAVDAILAKRWQAEDLVVLAKMQQWSLDALSNALNDRVSDPSVRPPAKGAAFVMRQQAATFGYNAPYYPSLQPNLRYPTVDGNVVFPQTDDRVLKTSFNNTTLEEAALSYLPGLTRPTGIPPAYPNSWEGNTLANLGGNSQIYLDSFYPAIAESSLIVIQAPNTAAPRVLATVSTNTAVTHSDFTLSAKVSLLQLAHTIDLTPYPMRQTTILCQSEPLNLTESPIDTTVSGTTFALDRVYIGLMKGQSVAVTGERSDLPGVTVAEIATLDSVYLQCGVTYVAFTNALTYSYNRSTMKINANLALATHGETVTETLGNGDGSQEFQSFPLHQAPLTYVSASTDTGTKTTLSIRVNDLLWTEVPFFYGHGPDEQIYIVRQDNSGVSTVTFGDGTTGSRLPTGSANVSATYRFGIGAAGEVAANQLTMLAGRPLGVRGVINPVPAVNSADPETVDGARDNATLTIRTLGRIVSLEDYEDFAQAFAGISKALATWSWNGERRIVLLTVAGTNGEAIDTSQTQPGTLAGDLLTAISNSSEPGTLVQLFDYQARFFKVEGNVDIDPAYEVGDVAANIDQTIRTTFGFAQRSFGQAVHRSEVIAAIQNVPGVIDVDINYFYRSDSPRSNEVHIPAALPRSGGTDFFAAEILVIDPSPLGLTETQ